MLRSLLLPTAALGATSLFVLSTPAPVTAAPAAAAASGFEGAVYAMTNDFVSNRIVAYGRRSDGTLELLGDFPTGGQGAAFDGGEGLDPLISAYAVLLTDDQDFLLAVNAGNNSITAFRVTEDFRLRRTDIVRSGGFGPNSIAYRDGFVTVSNIDADGAFAGEPDQEGSLLSFRLTPEGKLRAIPGSRRILGNRPSAVQYTPDGQHLVVASINAGSAALASGSNDEIVSYGVDDFGRLTEAPLGAGASTLPFNTANRNLASAIGFEIVESGDRNFVVVTEAREFTSEGLPPTLPNLQTGSVSTWELLPDGSLDPLQLDVLAGTDMLDGQRTACWIEFSADEKTFWVSNALESTISAYSFNQGQIALISEVAAAGTAPDPNDPFGTSDGWIDMWASEDGRYLYQLFGLAGTIGVYETVGSSLQLVQTVSDLPVVNTQGIVAF
ncbi:MAG: hypothetical protein AAF957_23250 [Planctomycetota bacterium]